MQKIKKLQNGLRLITVPMVGTKTVTVLVIFGAGSKYENKQNNGISHFLEHMFFKGTKKRPDTLAISSVMDSVGAEFNAFTSKEYTGYYVKIDGRKINLAIDVLSDILLNSKIDEAEVEREKGVIIEEIKMYDENPMMHIEDVFETCLYGDTPAGWDTAGPKENIIRFKREDFIKYMSSHYSAGNAIVCLAGNIKDGSIKEIEKKFSGLKNFKTETKVKVTEAQTKPAVKLEYKKTTQANIALGVRTGAIGAKDEFITKLLSVILGGSMSSRLFINLRERNGLAYYVRTQTETYTDTGYLVTQAGVPSEKIEQSMKIILNEYKRLTTELVSKKELNNTKDLIFGKTAIQLESSDNVATFFGRHALLRGRVFTTQEYLKMVKSVTAEDLRRVAKKIFVDKNLNFAAIGPYKDNAKLLKILKF